MAIFAAILHASSLLRKPNVIGEGIDGASVAMSIKESCIDEPSTNVVYPLLEWMVAAINTHGDFKCGQTRVHAHMISSAMFIPYSVQVFHACLP